MKKPSPFLVYDASAGSGKTFTLVKEYLKSILQSKNPGHYKQLLAITFTNKAVGEMKERIIKNLVEFASEETKTNPSQMFLQLIEETGYSLDDLHLQSKKILKHLLHHYAGFSVETIDRFNHRLIRTFARDLKLSSSFEVSLDIPQLLSEAVDQLISKAGEDQNITKVLLDFALEKTDDDRSWDISKDLAKTSKLIFDESERPHVIKLKDKSLEDFVKFRGKLLQQKKTLSEEIIAIATESLLLINESGLEMMDFSRGYFPKYLTKLSEANFDVNFNLGWQEGMGEKPMYTGKTLKDAPHIAETIDALLPRFISYFEASKVKISNLQLIDAILKNLVPLSVINLVGKEIEIIKEEKNILPISEFNSLIYTEIKNQPAPFIYERLGEKYKHFFIDEFQDTSSMQWENLIPLIDNALSQQDAEDSSGTLLLVGDAKQSIYRWRGGLPEQFIGLRNKENPFPIEKQVENLATNYRSCENIIGFNNQFFELCSQYLSSEQHQTLYIDGNKQLLNSKKGGFVKFEFIEKQTKAEKDVAYASLVHKTIVELKQKGFSESDICILTRIKKDGIALGTYLMEKGIPVVSQETLLLKQSAMVNCLIQTLTLGLFPSNEEAKIALLEILHARFELSEEKHSFFTKFLNGGHDEFSKNLSTYGIDFSFQTFHSLSLYEAYEYAIRKFNLDATADAYLFAFMDVVFEFDQQPQAAKTAFLEYWENKKDALAVPVSEGIEAVQLMTIHKAKGLEFPVVLFPYADINIYDNKKGHVWYPLTDYDFDEAFVNYNKELENFGEIGSMLYSEGRKTQELDNLNLLYVTLTRAIEQLYIFSELPSEPKDGKPSSYNHLFGAFLKHQNKWSEGTMFYELGQSERTVVPDKSAAFNQTTPIYISTSPQDHNLNIVTSDTVLWEEEIKNAISAGNLLHDTMAEIITTNDILPLFTLMEERGIIASEALSALKETVLSITNHPDLKRFFTASDGVRTESDIMTASGMLLRPDRINFHEDDSVTVIDYKTGTPNYSHEDQINVYASALKEMGYRISEKLLIYTKESEIIINKV